MCGRRRRKRQVSCTYQLPIDGLALANPREASYYCSKKKFIRLHRIRPMLDLVGSTSKRWHFSISGWRRTLETHCQKTHEGVMRHWHQQSSEEVTGKWVTMGSTPSSCGVLWGEGVKMVQCISRGKSFEEQYN